MLACTRESPETSSRWSASTTKSERLDFVDELGMVSTKMRERRGSFRYRRGVYLPEMQMWLDPQRWARLAVVSHAHADHAGRHAAVIASPATLALMRVRGVHPLDARPLEFGAVYDLPGGRIELFPAGHVLGSAQVRVTGDSGTLVYTGDFKLRSSLSCEAAEVRPADVLIMETTFGLPRYRFPPEEEVRADIVRFCRETLAGGAVPVLLGYSLGKAQEILAILAGTGFELIVHKSIARVCRIYQGFGRSLPPHDNMAGQNLAGKVLILPPSASRSSLISRLSNIRTAMVTGWGLDPSARYRFGCDAVFPLSDHADYDDLLRYVERVNPRIVYTLHGSAEAFAQDLRARGVEAWSLISNNQLELPFDR